MSNPEEIEKIESPVPPDVEDKATGPLAGVQPFNLDKFIKEKKETPKQDYSTEQTSTSETTDPTPEPEQPKKEGANTSAENRKQAERMAKTLDRLAAFGMSWFAKEENSDLYRAKEAELKWIIDDVVEQMDEVGSSFKLPPWIGLVIGILLAYGPVIRKAKKDRDRNIAAENKKKREAAKEANQLSVLKAQDNGHFAEAVVVVDNSRKCKYCDAPLTGNKKSYCSSECRIKGLNDK